MSDGDPLEPPVLDLPTPVVAGATARTFTITWAWNEQRTIADFKPGADVLALDIDGRPHR